MSKKLWYTSLGERVNNKFVDVKIPNIGIVSLVDEKIATPLIWVPQIALHKLSYPAWTKCVGKIILIPKKAAMLTMPYVLGEYGFSSIQLYRNVKSFEQLVALCNAYQDRHERLFLKETWFAPAGSLRGCLNGLESNIYQVN